MDRLLPGTLLAIALCGPLPASELARTISVSGEGETSAPPDVAFIQTGVASESPQARQALAQNTAAMQRIFTLLKQRGIPERDIRTTHFNVTPLAKRDKAGIGEEFLGYRVDNQVRVRLTDVDALGEVLDALVAAGSNRVSGIEFDIRDPGSALDEARKRAIADARARAELYAAAAGVKVGNVVSISEQGAGAPPPQRYMRHMMIEQASAVPVAPGAQTIHASVTVVYTLLD